MLWQWVGWSVTLTHSGASELAQLMEGTTAGALIPEIVRRGFLVRGSVASKNPRALPGGAWQTTSR